MSASAPLHAADTSTAGISTVESENRQELVRELAQQLSQHFTVHQGVNKSSLAKKAGLSLQEYQAVEFIQELQGLSSGQLAQLLDISSGGVHALLNRLETAGFIWRAPHPSDRRMTALYPHTERCALILPIVHDPYVQRAMHADPVQMMAVYDFMLNQLRHMQETSQQWLQDKHKHNPV